MTDVPRAFRDGDRRWIGGVASGLAEHLGWPVGWTRAGFLLLAMASGTGIALYAVYWLMLPLRPSRTPRPRGPELLPILALGALLLGTTLLASSVAGVDQALLVALVVAAVGTALIWQQADEAGPATPWRVGLGVALIGGGAFVLVADVADPLQAARTLLTGAIIAAGLVLLALPWIRQQWRTANAERARRIRADERAEVAAQVHDSVLQTLTLIRSNAADAEKVAQLARAEERRLRTWLYQPPGDPDATLRPALENLAAQIEGAYPVTVEVVTVGDCPQTAVVSALLAAAREALTNAAKHAGGQVSLYAEAGADEVAVFVRDRGPGFDPRAVPADRLGVRESIIGRMERNGGTARIRSGPTGTEIVLEVAP